MIYSIAVNISLCLITEEYLDILPLNEGNFDRGEHNFVFHGDASSRTSW